MTSKNQNINLYNWKKHKLISNNLNNIKQHYSDYKKLNCEPI